MLQSPKAMNKHMLMAGILTCSPPARPSHPDKIRTVTMLNWTFGKYGAYSCGTVTELHRIPF